MSDEVARVRSRAILNWTKDFLEILLGVWTEPEQVVKKGSNAVSTRMPLMCY